MSKELIDQLQEENNRLRRRLAALEKSAEPRRNDPNTPFDMFEKEELYAILEDIPVAVSWADDKGNVEFNNRKFKELFGYDLTDMPTVQKWFKLAYPDPAYRESVVPKWVAIVEEAQRQGKAVENMEADVTCKDGSVRNVVVKTTLIADRVLAIFDDLTESRRIQRALMESEGRFKAVLNNVKDGMLVADQMTKEFYLANASIMEMLRYAEDEILNLTVADIHPKEALPKVIEDFERLARGEIQIAPDVPVLRKDGEIFYADISSGTMNFDGRDCLVGIFRDISERKKYAEAILQERDFSDAALNSLPGVFYMFDQNGRFLRWNRNFEIITGYSAKEMKEILVLDLFEGEERAHVLERIQETFTKGSSDVEANFVSKDGTKAPYYFTGLRANIGGQPCLIGMGIDITRRKQAEKMQALGQLAGGIAHDFNNQLSAILGFAQMLMVHLEDERLKGYAEMIARAAGRSADLTKQLLAFARKGKYQAEPLDIHMIIAEVVTLLHHSIDKRILVKQNLNAVPSVTMGDANQIQNALLNLAINGRDAMPDGGQLVFSTSHETIDESFCRNAGLDIPPGRYLKISITDTGMGMNTDVQRRLFEPFFTTKAMGRGTGMGLAAVYGTVKNHKGGIVVTSKQGRGSTFDVYLPLVEDFKAPRKKVTPTGGKPKNRTARILVVDDERMVRMLVADILESEGYEVVLCKDGKEAVDLYQIKWKEIDLVILDLIMPNLSGVETFTALRNINPSAGILLSSGYSIGGQAQALLEAGALGFAQKPFTIKQLIEKVARVLKQCAAK